MSSQEDLVNIRLDFLENANQKLTQENQALSHDLQNVQKEMEQLKGQTGTHQLDAISEEVRSLRQDLNKIVQDRKTTASSKKSKEEVDQRLSTRLDGVDNSLQQYKIRLGELGGSLLSLESMVSKLETSLHTLQSEELKDLKKNMVAWCQAISFHAKLRSDVTETEQKALVCGDVDTNQGGGYDPDSGVFRCPVSGTYLFLATSSPNQLDPDKAAALDVLVEGRVRGGLCAYGYHWATAHSVVEAQEGDEVWLRTLPGEHHYAGQWWTTFTGLLLKPAL